MRQALFDTVNSQKAELAELQAELQQVEQRAEDAERERAALQANLSQWEVSGQGPMSTCRVHPCRPVRSITKEGMGSWRQALWRSETASAAHKKGGNTGQCWPWIRDQAVHAAPTSKAPSAQRGLHKLVKEAAATANARHDRCLLLLLPHDCCLLLLPPRPLLAAAPAGAVCRAEVRRGAQQHAADAAQKDAGQG